MISWPPVNRPRPRGANTGRNDGIGLRVTERVEKDSGESERPVVSSRRGNHPEGPRGERGRHVMTPLEGNMAGASKPLTVDTKQQQIARPAHGGPCAVPWRAHDVRSRMPERARTDLWEPWGSNPLGPPGPGMWFR